MPDKRKHRGAHPADDEQFAEGAQPGLRAGVADLSWLLSRGYAGKSSLKLVGDRYALTQRQRMAVMRSGCGDEQLARRREKEVGREGLGGKVLRVDGYNVLTTVETALGGGVVLRGRDGCMRDIAGVHGTYRKVDETARAMRLVGELVARAGVRECVWYLDRPVSNSGRLKGILLKGAEEQHWNWQVEVVYNPDEKLAESEDVVATSDSEILNRCGSWFNLAGAVVEESVEEAFLVDLGGEAGL